MKNLETIVLCISIFLVACGPKINETQEKQLSVLTNKIDSVVVAINAIDSAAVINLAIDFHKKKEFLEKEMKDTLDRATIFRLDNFLQYKKAMNFVAGEYSKIKKEAYEMQKQLTDLNHDVDNGLIEEKQFDKYYELEKGNFEKLKFASERLVDVSDKILKTYSNYSPIADSLITAYKAKMDE